MIDTLTHERIDTLKRRELNAVVAEFVLGWQRVRFSDRYPEITRHSVGVMLMPPDEVKDANDCEETLFYSTDIDGYEPKGSFDEEVEYYSEGTDMSATWQVVKRMESQGWSTQIHSFVKDETEWRVVFYKDKLSSGADGPSIALNICRAALHALIEVGQ